VLDVGLFGVESGMTESEAPSSSVTVTYLKMHQKEVFPCFLDPEENYLTWFEKE